MKFPNQLFVYIDGKGDDACLIAVSDISEIPEDQHGESVGVYLHSTLGGVLIVKKELK